MKSKFSEIVKDTKPVLVDFYADWCGPCQVLAPILEEVKSDLGDKVKIIKIDVDKNQALATNFHVRGVPTLILFKEGEQVWRQSGLVSKRDLTELIESHQ